MKFEFTPDFTRHPLLPAIVQDAASLQVLMLGYMNADAWARTCETGRVTFWSRSRNQLWTKGETSGNYLRLVDARLDCDADTLLLRVQPAGPVCHTGDLSCFHETPTQGFIYKLESVLSERIRTPAAQPSYTQQLYAKGVAKMAQKVGEEGVEVVIEALRGDRERLLEESADLLMHLLLLLQSQDLCLEQVEAVLQARHTARMG